MKTVHESDENNTSTHFYMKWNDWCFRPRLCAVKLIWAGDNLGEWDEFCYELCPLRRIDHLTCWPAVQRYHCETDATLHFCRTWPRLTKAQEVIDAIESLKDLTNVSIRTHFSSLILMIALLAEQQLGWAISASIWDPFHPIIHFNSPGCTQLSIT